MKRWALLYLLLMAVSVAADQADTDAAVDRDRADRQLLAQLGDADYYVRRAAHEQLLQREDFSEHVERWLQRADHVEQVHRLLDAARHHFVRQLHEQAFGGDAPGAVGISHTLMPAGTIEQIKTPVVMVIRTVPGFPGHAYLRPDDLIVELDGEPLPDTANTNTFGNWIQQYGNGEQIVVGVWRDGRVQTVRITLASAAALQALYPAGGVMLRLEPRTAEQWERRKAHLLELTREKQSADSQ